jgi:hypothetical protein
MVSTHLRIGLPVTTCFKTKSYKIILTFVCESELPRKVSKEPMSSSCLCLRNCLLSKSIGVVIWDASTDLSSAVRLFDKGSGTLPTLLWYQEKIEEFELNRIATHVCN